MSKQKTKIAVIGHFAFGQDLLNGQTIKTVSVTRALEQRFGSREVIKKDTSGGVKALLKLPLQVISSLKNAENIIIFPAQRGLRVMVPLLIFCNAFFHRKLHYCVIGGWLFDELQNRRRLLRRCQRLDGIYVETECLRRQLISAGFQNVVILKNFKDLSVNPTQRTNIAKQRPIKACIFSRIIKEKGIEEAVKAVTDYNRHRQDTVFSLDIFGPVPEIYHNRFFDLMRQSPQEIRYCGTVAMNRSVSVISGYDLLLFPTYYEGEGFAGTILDAFFSGTPIAASDWRYNAEIIRDGETGILFPAKDANALLEVLKKIDSGEYDLDALSVNEKQEAEKYLPQNALRPLSERLT